MDDLLEIIPEVDAIEIFNARCMLPHFNARARDFARQYALPGTVGSDAHAVLEMGRAMLRLEDFVDAAELRACLPAGTARTRWSPPWFHLLSRYATLHKRWRGTRRP
jgi:hypothetical protein